MPLKAYLFLESFLFCFLTDIGERGCFTTYSLSQGPYHKQIDLKPWANMHHYSSFDLLRYFVTAIEMV